MKKLMAVLLIATLLCAVLPAYADDIELDGNTQTGETRISLTIDRSLDKYTFVIPSDVTIDPETKSGSFTVTLKAGFELIACNSISIALASAANGIKKDMGAAFTLVDSETGKTASYTIYFDGKNLCEKTDSAATGYTNFNCVAISATKATPTTNDIEAVYSISLNTLPSEGVYTDTLTFKVTVK